MSDTKNRIQAALRDAAHRGDATTLEKLIKNGGNVNPTYDFLQGTSLLHLACKEKHEKIVNILLQNGADVTKTTVEDLTVLHVAASLPHAKLVKTLLEHNIDSTKLLINARTINGDTALHFAAKKSCLLVIKYLMNSGATYDIKNCNELTPKDVSKPTQCFSFFQLVDKLFKDVKNGDKCVIKKIKSLTLIESMAILNTRNIKGKTLLLVALKNKEISKELVSILKDHKVFSGLEDQQLQYLYVTNRFLRQLIILIYKNAFNLFNDGKISFLNECENGFYLDVEKFSDSIKLLFQKKNSELLLQFCENNKFMEVEKLITRTHLAVFLHGHSNHNDNIKNEFVRELQKHGDCDKNLSEIIFDSFVKSTDLHSILNSSNYEGFTPMHFAVKNNSLRSIKLLLTFGASYNIKNDQGKTPLDVPNRCNKNVFEFLKMIDEIFKSINAGDLKVIEQLTKMSEEDLQVVINARDHTGKPIISLLVTNAQLGDKNKNYGKIIKELIKII